MLQFSDDPLLPLRNALAFAMLELTELLPKPNPLAEPDVINVFEVAETVSRIATYFPVNVSRVWGSNAVTAPAPPKVFSISNCNWCPFKAEMAPGTRSPSPPVVWHPAIPNPTANRANTIRNFRPLLSCPINERSKVQIDLCQIGRRTQGCPRLRNLLPQPCSEKTNRP